MSLRVLIVEVKEHLKGLKQDIRFSVGFWSMYVSKQNFSLYSLKYKALFDYT